MATTEQSIQAHYRTSNLLERILSGLRAAGKDPDAPSVEDLAPADDFHSLGRAATRELAELAEIPADSKVCRGSTLSDRRVLKEDGMYTLPSLP